MKRNILTTFKKEIRSIFRDQKTLITMLLFPFIIPAMIFFYGFMYDSLDDETITYQVLANYELNDSEKELASSMQLEFTYLESEEQIKNTYEEDTTYSGYILYNSDTNTYTLYAPTSTSDGLTFLSVVQSYYEVYSQNLTNVYLTSEGIDLETAYHHFDFTYVELDSNNYLLTLVLSVCFMYIVMSICSSTGNMAIAATAQEKENGTLETILTLPVKKEELIIGKYLACAVIGFLSSLIGLILTCIGIVLGREWFQTFKNFYFQIDVSTILWGIFIIFLGSFLIAGLALVLTSRSKSFKEAQGKVSFLSMVSLIPMFVSLMSLDTTNWMYAIPICNFETLLMSIYTGSFTLSQIGICTCSTLVLIVLTIIYMIQTYHSEEILFQQ